MKIILKCVNNENVENFLTINEEYIHEDFSHDYFITPDMYRVKGGWFLKERFEVLCIVD